MSNKISYEQREQTYMNALIRYGTGMQCIVAVEELSEAQKEICKALRGKLDKDHLAEEIADATIVLEQMRIFFGINDMVCEKMDEKIQRLDDRLKGADSDGETVAKF